MDYALLVAIATACAFGMLIPLRIRAGINAKKKKEVEPLIKAIKEKYGINKLGASVDENIKDETGEILKMTSDDREQKAAEEIEATYKEHGYHVWTSWIPTVVEMGLIIALYFCITRFCPDGIYKTSAFKTLFSGQTDAKVMIIYIAFVLVEIFSIVMNMLKTGFKGKSKYATIIIAAVQIGIGVYIIWTVSPAILTGIVVLRFCSSIYSIIAKRVASDKADL